MALDPALATWMTDLVQVRKNTGAAGGGYGGAGLAAAKNWKVRIEQVTRKAISAASGEEVVSSTTLYGKPAYEDGTVADLALNDEVTLPAGYAPQKPPVISVRRHNDEDGSLHHLEVLL